MKKTCAALLTVCIVLLSSHAFAAESNATYGEMDGKTLVSGLCSFILWPGIGQYLNDCETDKNIAHAILGLTVIFRFWSGWDALVDRQGGYWEGRI